MVRRPVDIHRHRRVAAHFPQRLLPDWTMTALAADMVADEDFPAHSLGAEALLCV
jgi:hypothetical protein